MKRAMGKSALTLGVALADADSGRPTLVHSLEMGKAEVNNQILATRLRVALHHLMDGGPAPADGDWPRMLRMVPDLRDRESPADPDFLLPGGHHRQGPAASSQGVVTAPHEAARRSPGRSRYDHDTG
ncbi:hypothetical protein ACF1BE_31130 [Streptomyces sp. NPDC014991]|uniref:hypothetical protein n=1 Tax=Streptomyces sp. NPDC014991 TaxID=3364935 RepID=UPI0036F56790